MNESIKLKRGYFVALDGLDGSGKTTQIQILNERLNRRGYDTVLTRAPGGCETADLFRKVFLESFGQLDVASEIALLAASIQENYTKVIAPALAAGKIVITDRWTFSTVAYQAYGRNIDVDLVHRILGAVLTRRTTNLAIYLKIDLDTQERRLSARPEKRSIIDSKGYDYFQRVLDGYASIFQAPVITGSLGDGQSMVTVDGTDEEGAVADILEAVVLNRVQNWEQRFGLQKFNHELPLQPKKEIEMPRRWEDVPATQG